jgi:hypothetical protein
VGGHTEQPGPGGGQAALQLIGEQQVGQLALGVHPGQRVALGGIQIAEVDMTAAVTTRAAGGTVSAGSSRPVNTK